MSDKNENYKDVFINTFLSTFSSIIGTSLTQPFDIIKTRRQVDLEQANKSIFQSITTIISKEGTLALFRGALVPILGDSLVLSSLFSFHYNYVYILNQNFNHLSEYNKIFIAGSLSGLTMSLPSTAIELIKIRVQNTRGEYTGTNQVNLINEIQLESGIKIFQRGLVATMIRDTFPTGLMMMAVDIVPREMRGMGYSEFLSNSVSSMLALLASWLIQPADKLKSIVQSRVMQQQSWRVGLQLFVNIQAERGVYGQFDGYLTLLIRAVPQQFIIIMMNNQLTDMQFRYKKGL